MENTPPKSPFLGLPYQSRLSWDQTTSDPLEQHRRSRDMRRSNELARRSGVYTRASADLTRVVIHENGAADGVVDDDVAVEADDEADGDRALPRSSTSRARMRARDRDLTRSPRASFSRPTTPFTPDGMPIIGKRSSSLQIDRADINVDALMAGRLSQDQQSRLEAAAVAQTATSAAVEAPPPHGQTQCPSAKHDAQGSRAEPEPQPKQATDDKTSEASPGFGLFRFLRRGAEPKPQQRNDDAQSSENNNASAGLSTGLSESGSTRRSFAPGETMRTTETTSGSGTLVASSSGQAATAQTDKPRASTSASQQASSLDLYNTAIRQKLATLDISEPQSLYAHPDKEGQILLADDQPTQRRGLSMDHARKSGESYGMASAKGRASVDHGVPLQTGGGLLDVPRSSVRGPSMDLRHSVDGLRADISRHGATMTPTMLLRRSMEVGRSMDLARPSMTFSSYGRDSLARSSYRPSMSGARDDNDVAGFAELERVTTEPVRGGPMATAPFSDARRYRNAEGIEDIHDMKTAVAAVGAVLEERKRRGLAASKSKDGKFWLAFMGIAMTGFLSATDMTIIAPILPTIASDLPASQISATWITSAFLLTMTAFQPLWGGVSDAVGRRSALLAALFIFTMGSIPCTIAKTMVTMVAGRGLQGVGGGGMLVVGEVMLSDMTTLAERGYFLGLLSMAFAAAAIAAPLVGGVFATGGGLGWRWAFLINFPIAAISVAFVMCANHLHVPKLTWREKLAHLDAPSSLILFGSTLSLLIGLTRGAEDYGWSSASVLPALVFGALGYIAYFTVQWWPHHNVLAPRPILSRQLFFKSGRSAPLSFALTFFHGLLLYGAVQTLILYFEARDASPIKAAINVLPANAPSTPAAFIAGILMAVTGRYKGLIIGSQLLMLVGFGMFVYLDAASPTYQWALFQVIASLGIGALYTLTLPPIQASVPPAYLARATATFAFLRSFGATWGISSTLIAFSAQASKELAAVPGASAAGLNGATAIGATTSIKTLPLDIRESVRDAFIRSLRIAFASLVPFAFIGFILALFLKHVPLPNFNSSEFGLEEKKPEAAQESEKGTWRIQHDQAQGGNDASDHAVDLEKGFGKVKSGKMQSMDIARQGQDSSPTIDSMQSPRGVTSDSYADSLRRSNSFWH